MRIPTLLSTATLVALTLSATVGCSVDLSQPAKNKQTPTQAPQSAGGGSNSSTATGSPGSGGSSAPSASSASSAAADTPLKFSGIGVTQTLDCSGRDVEIDGGGNTLVFKGACGTITVVGAANTIAVESVDTLRLKSQANTVYVKTVGAIHTADASNSTVDWVRGMGGNSPEMSGGGSLNTVEQISEEEYESDLS